MSNVKPGDRAVVIKANEPANIGKIVLVIDQYTGGLISTDQGPRPFEPLLLAPGLYWNCESLGGPFHYKDFLGGIQVGAGTAAVAPFADDRLRRLDPPEDEQLGQDEGLSTPVKDSQTVEVQS